MNIHFGIIGYGFMGHKHARLLEQLSWAKLVGVCDIEVSQMQDVQPGIQRYTSADELLKNARIDVVIIAANNNQHLSLICKAAQAGKNILCEKPVCLSSTELDEAIKVVSRCGVKFTVHQQRRLDKDYLTAKAVFDQKLLGDVYLVRSMLYGYNGNMHDWHVYLSEGGGMLYDWGVHLFDQVMSLTDYKIKTVFADVRNVINFEVDDFFKVIFKLHNDLLIEVELGTYYLSDKPGWFGHHWYLAGEKGSAYIDGFAAEGKIVRTTKLLENVEGIRTNTAAGPTRSFGATDPDLLKTEPLPQVETDQIDYYHNFYKAYQGQEEFMVTIPQVRRGLLLLEAIRESAKLGQSVTFE